MKTISVYISAILFMITGHCSAEDKVELETTFIKGNKELPQVLYVVPWKDMKKEKSKSDVIVLHSLFGDAFDPATPKDLGQ